MPVIVVTGPPLSQHATTGMLRSVTTSVARALTLQPDSVHAMFVAAQTAATGRRAVAAWPTAILHGSARPTPAMEEAARVLVNVLADAWQAVPDEVWVQWQVRQ